MQNPESSPPPRVLLEIMMGAWVSQAVGTFARLKMADVFTAGPTAASVVAEKLGTHPDATHRLLRACKNIGIVRETSARTYVLTPLGELLRSNVPGSMRALLDAESAPGHWIPWGHLDDCVRKGGPVASRVLGMDPWSYYEKHPEEGRAFSEGMSGLSAMAIGAIASTGFDFGKPTTVVDVGGSHGAFLSFVLSKTPEAKGVMFDLPHVTATALPSLVAAGVSDRVSIESGDFTKNVPRDGDLYLVKHIVHDWDDETNRTILKNIRAAMNPKGRVIVVEMLIPTDESPSPAPLLDLNMMVMLPGRERTIEEMKVLFSSAGFQTNRVVSTPSPFSLLELSPST